MRADRTTPIPELLDPRYHETARIIARARAANPYASPEDIAAGCHIRIALVRAAFGLNVDGDPVVAPPLKGGSKARKISAVNPADTKPALWSERSEQRLKELKAAKAKHIAWLEARGIVVVEEPRCG